MTELDALQTLLAKVEAGEAENFDPLFEFAFYSDQAKMENVYCANDANQGSLDAAKALHEAVLTGWEYNLAPTFCHVFPSHDNGDQEASTGNDNNPARAWLIAIIKALIAMETPEK